jgi:hypothetical protein
MKLIHFLTALVGLFLLPLAAMAGTVTLESRGVAGVSGWSPVLVVRENSGATHVLGLPGVSYVVAVSGVVAPNTMLYSRDAAAWAAATYGETMVVDCSNRTGDDGAGAQGGCTW